MKFAIIFCLISAASAHRAPSNPYDPKTMLETNNILPGSKAPRPANPIYSEHWHRTIGDVLTQIQTKGPNLAKMAKAMRRILEEAQKHFTEHFLPALTRVRRDTGDEEDGFYLDAILTGMGEIRLVY